MPNAETLERARDLKSQLSELSGEPDQEIVFRDTSPRKQRIRIYSRINGEPLDVPSAIAARALEKRMDDGSFMFTTRTEQAPAYIQGSVKCFLHMQSPERLAGVLDAVGLSGITCTAGKLASAYSKRIHAQHRHRQQWEAYQEHVSDEKQRVTDERQTAQIEATLALARQAAGAPAILDEVRHDCEACGWVNDKNTVQGLEIHKTRWCKEKPDEVTE